MSRSESIGLQIKFEQDGFWYKKDCFGYQALVEYWASMLAQQSSLAKWGIVTYEPVLIGGEVYSKSKSFLKPGYTEITLNRLLCRYFHTDLKGLYDVARDKFLQEYHKFLLEAVEEITGLDIEEYLGTLFKFDYLILNDDRHYHNIGFMRAMDGSFKITPTFDFGAGLYSDTAEHPLDQPLGKLYACPLDTDFERQCALYKGKLVFNSKLVLVKDSILYNMYPKEIVERAKSVLTANFAKLYPEVKLIWD